MTGTENRRWRIRNLDTNEMVEGQFEPTQMRKRFGSSWARIQALGRAQPILQYVGGLEDSFEFVGVVYARDNTDTQGAVEVMTLERWALKQQNLQRPPLLAFEIGDGHIGYDRCVIDGDVSITYGRMRADGSFMSAQVALRLLRFDPFTLNGVVANANTESGRPESRYATAQAGDYYELLCAREYGDPLLGDAVRKRNPGKPDLLAGDRVKLPSLAAIRDSVLAPTSLPLAGSQARKPTPARLNFLDTLERRAVGRATHFLKQ